jgi:hypothetical protein
MDAMSDEKKPGEKVEPENRLFGASAPGSEGRGGMPMAVWGVAVLVVLAGVAALVFVGRRDAGQKPSLSATAPEALAPYAAKLPISGIKMSQADDFGGGTLTYIDGHIRNTGQKTVTGITVQTIFRNDIGELPQVVTMPLMLIRTREPYVDTQPVSAAPLQPGAERDFRLIFDHVTANWNQQYPEVHVVAVEGK